jgi:exodeoxyribonuclease VII large subunit
VIVVARGGGSVADLAAFDDEELCRIAARNPVPIVAAVGHTANRPVIYQVAELTASVPREVGLVVVPDRRELAGVLDRASRDRVRHQRAVSNGDERLAALSRRRGLQSACLNSRSHALAAGGRRLDDFIRDFHTRRLEDLAAATERRRAAVRKVPGADRLDTANARLAGVMRRAMDAVTVNAAQRLAATLARIRAHDPSLQGFAVVQAGARVLRRARDLRPGQSATIVFCDGRAEATIESVHQSKEESDA